MAIDVFREEVIGFKEAAKRLPKLRRGRRISLATFWRWKTAGHKAPDGSRVRLETVKVGGVTCTSIEALQRFFDRLTGDLQVVTPPSPTQRERLRRIRQAEEELARAGI